MNKKITYWEVTWLNDKTVTILSEDRVIIKGENNKLKSVTVDELREGIDCKYKIPFIE